MDIAELKQKSVAELHALAEQLNIQNYSGLRKQDLIFRIEQTLLDQDTVIRGEGVLEILPEGYGFLRSQDWNYLYGPDDIYVSPSQIKRFDLRTGDTVMGQVRPPKEGERYLALLKVESVNYEEPEKTKHRIAFDNLRPRYPDRRIVQTWRTKDFPADAPDSLLELTLTAVPEGTRLDLAHSRIPRGQGVRYHSGWHERYFVPMARYFAGTAF